MEKTWAGASSRVLASRSRAAERTITGTSATLGIAHNDWTVLETRRGSCTLRAHVVTTIRPDVAFVPYHWGGPKSINQLTISAQDPISKIPEYKVCAVRIESCAMEPE